MAHWVKCTRRSDNTPIYINLETVSWLRWNDEEGFTAISWARGEDNIIRARERPNEIFAANEDDFFAAIDDEEEENLVDE
jgi:hypothetical protein